MATNAPLLAFIDGVGTPEVWLILAIILVLFVVPKLMEFHAKHRNSR